MLVVNTKNVPRKKAVSPKKLLIVVTVATVHPAIIALITGPNVLLSARLSVETILAERARFAGATTSAWLTDQWIAEMAGRAPVGGNAPPVG
jgi:hypothetical protein